MIAAFSSEPCGGTLADFLILEVVDVLILSERLEVRWRWSAGSGRAIPAPTLRWDVDVRSGLKEGGV